MRKSRTRIKAVVDTNLIISSTLSKLGLPYLLIQTYFRNNYFILLISTAMRAELEDVIHRPRFETRFGLTAQTRDDLLFLMDTKGVVVKPRRNLPISVRDPKDNIVLAAALGGKADYLVTGDRDLLDLNDNPLTKPLKIITVREFLKILENTN